MNPLKKKMLDELLTHLEDSQGGDLKSMLDESKKPALEDLADGEEDPQGLKIQSVELMGKEPKAPFDDKVNQAINDQGKKDDGSEHETVGSKIGYPGFPKPKKAKPTAMLEGEMSEPVSGEKEMDDDELEELLKHYLG